MSPPIDLIVGCGAWSLPLLILPYVFGDMGLTGALAFSTLSVVVNGPHYMATIYRAYRTREDFARYRVRTLYFTLLLTVVLIAAHGFYRMVPLQKPVKRLLIVLSCCNEMVSCPFPRAEVIPSLAKEGNNFSVTAKHCT